ncbi:MAG: DUF2730 family protein [Gammaproteobacteria bacterium]|nr:DUF2730 family protein [Gammaproteobacteria bacterium]
MNEIITFIESHWGIVLTVCGALLSIVYLKLDARYARKTDIGEDIAELHKGQSEMAERLDLVEQEIKHLPTAVDIADLRIAVHDMKGETKTLNATVKGLSRLVDLLVEKEVKE